MDSKEKRRSILKNRRHEVGKEYARRREMEEDGEYYLDTDGVTISIENLQAHLQSLSKDITMEKHQYLINEYKKFFDELGNDKNVLFEMIGLYKEKRAVSELDIDQGSIQLLQDRVKNKIPTIDTGEAKEIDINATTSLETWNKFNDMVHKTGLSQTDCISLALRLFVDYCSKVLAQSDESKDTEQKSPSARVFKKI